MAKSLGFEATREEIGNFIDEREYILEALDANGTGGTTSQVKRIDKIIEEKDVIDMTYIESQLIFIKYSDNYDEQLIYGADGKITEIHHLLNSVVKGTTTFDYKDIVVFGVTTKALSKTTFSLAS